ncbi:HepT-like ribonuclease domain-containing protein, partial [Klebsiella pneumoniae]|uniref:HepT-like ribonuclease domain-containing protein n=1 Tax=Klebsiella pneumoniae TaxID=573 RepID=UPI004067F101
NKTKGCLIANFATVPTQAHADVPWRSMRNMRNRMAHGYFDINLDVVWETVQEWLPALLQQLPAVRQDADDEDRNDNCERGISDDC